MSGERLHERAIELLGDKAAGASAEQYAEALQKAQGEGIEYERPATQESIADMERRLYQEDLQLVTEHELRQAGIEPSEATYEQLFDAGLKAEQAMQAAKAAAKPPAGPITPIETIQPIKHPKEDS